MTIDYKDKSDWICLICGKNMSSMKRHIEWGHKIKWEDYCSDAGWDNTKKQLFSKKHKESLSTQKKEFYQSDRGIEMRETTHSDNWGGDKNPACKPENKIKISNQRTVDASNKVGAFSKESREKHSKSMVKKYKSEFINRSTYGYKISFSHDGILYNCRSMEEFKIIHTLLINNEEFEYEKHSIEYKRPGDDWLMNSIVDLKYKGVYFEIKGLKRRRVFDLYEDEKYKIILSSAHDKDMTYIILNYSMFIELMKFDIIENWNDVIYDTLIQNTDNKIMFQNMNNKNTFFWETEERFNNLKSQIICTNGDIING